MCNNVDNVKPGLSIQINVYMHLYLFVVYVTIRRFTVDFAVKAPFRCYVVGSLRTGQQNISIRKPALYA